MKQIPMLVAVLALTGCATAYTHPTKTAQDFERDKYECEQVAVAAADHWGVKGNPFVIVDETKKCMRLQRGWVAVAR